MMHKHHIVFRSGGGLDFPLNFIYLTPEEHLGDNGPHKNDNRNKELKKGLQKELFLLFPANEEFDLETVSTRIGVTREYLEKPFRKVTNLGGLYKGEDIVRRLMGGKIY